MPTDLASTYQRTIAVLAELVTLGRSLRLDPESTICLSGSGALRGRDLRLADIDYCEYVSATTSPPVADLEHSLRGAETPRSGLYWLSSKVVDAEEATCRWLRETPRATGAIDLRRCVRGKVDFVTNTEAEGIVEVTNVFLVIGTRPIDVGRAMDSFAQQEVVLGNIVARTLDDIPSIASYVAFLLQQISSYAKTDIPKAAKRALSLATYLFLRHEHKALRDVVHSTGMEVGEPLCDQLTQAAFDTLDRLQHEGAQRGVGSDPSTKDAFALRIDHARRWAHQVVVDHERDVSEAINAVSQRTRGLLRTGGLSKGVSLMSNRVKLLETLSTLGVDDELRAALVDGAQDLEDHRAGEESLPTELHVDRLARRLDQRLEKLDQRLGELDGRLDRMSIFKRSLLQQSPTSNTTRAW